MKPADTRPELLRRATAVGAVEFADPGDPAVEWPRYDPARFGGFSDVRFQLNLPEGRVTR